MKKTNHFWDLFEAFMAETVGEDKATAFRAKAEVVGVKGCDWRTDSFKRVAACLGIKHQQKALIEAEAKFSRLAVDECMRENES